MTRADMKRRRQQLKLSQAELARRLGVCGDYLSKVERGVEHPSADLWERIELHLYGRNGVVKKARTAEEEWWHEKWVELYGN